MEELKKEKDENFELFENLKRELNIFNASGSFYSLSKIFHELLAQLVLILLVFVFIFLQAVVVSFCFLLRYVNAFEKCVLRELVFSHFVFDLT